MVIHIDGKMQNDILKKTNNKPVTKTQRDVEFNISRAAAARDFLWHIRRIHHWWNCAGADNQHPGLTIEDIK